jgi:KAP family P-loop domain
MEAAERPIKSQSDDRLERGEFVRRLTDALVNPRTKKATGLVIGIAGPWASGKSSILNLLHENIRSSYDDALVVRFDPWLPINVACMLAVDIGAPRRSIRATRPQLQLRRKWCTI